MIFFQSRGLLSVFSNTTAQKHQLFGAQPPFFCYPARPTPAQFSTYNESVPNLIPITSSRKTKILNPILSQESYGPKLTFVLSVWGLVDMSWFEESLSFPVESSILLILITSFHSSSLQGILNFQKFAQI